MFHTVVQRGVQEAPKNVYICFVDNSWLFPRVTKFNRLTIDEVIAKIRRHVIF